MNEKCKTCKFWLVRTSALGACRRMPPTVASATSVMWPHTSPGDWCGEYTKSREVQREEDLQRFGAQA